MPSGVYVRDPEKIASRTIAEPIDESRQEYATYHVQRFQQSAFGPLDFGVMLEFFRDLGALYDRGHRIRDSRARAA